MRVHLTQTVTCILAIFVAFTPVFSAPKKKKKSRDPKPEVVAAIAKNQLEFVATIGTSMNSTVLSPLDKEFSHDIRPDLAALRDNLLDEAKANPVANQPTYAMAVRLTDAWLSALKERETRRASMGMTPAPTTDMDHIKSFQSRIQSEINAKEKKANDKQKRNFIKDAQKNNWQLRTDALRPNLDSLYSQFRELRRQNL